MSIKRIILALLVAAGTSLVLPTFLPAEVGGNVRPANPCTFCYLNPVTYTWACLNGATIGDYNCSCFSHTCALV